VRGLDGRRNAGLTHWRRFCGGSGGREGPRKRGCRLVFDSDLQRELTTARPRRHRTHGWALCSGQPLVLRPALQQPNPLAGSAGPRTESAVGVAQHQQSGAVEGLRRGPRQTRHRPDIGRQDPPGAGNSSHSAICPIARCAATHGGWPCRTSSLGISIRACSLC
jgi:hypothetical protein